LYPFGYGLSYTDFAYSDMTISSTTMVAGGQVQAAVTVTNTGQRAGTEVVQLYLRDVVGSISRPMMELKGFEKIALAQGESKTVTFTITEDLLKFYNIDLKYEYEPGDFEVMIGRNAGEVEKKTFTMQ
jgi:beta-glucosidase